MKIYRIDMNKEQEETIHKIFNAFDIEFSECINNLAVQNSDGGYIINNYGGSLNSFLNKIIKSNK